MQRGLLEASGGPVLKEHRLKLFDADLVVLVLVQESEEDVHHVLAYVLLSHPQGDALEFLACDAFLDVPKKLKKVSLIVISIKIINTFHY